MAPSREVKDWYAPTQTIKFIGRQLQANHPNSILGIDFGSTALRGGLLERDTHGFQPVENTETSQTGSYGKGDFPTACCPFKENPLDYLGKRAQSEPNNVQAKYLVYLLVGAEDNILSEYPLSAELRRMRGNKEFLAKCRAILVELLRRLKARIDEVCRKRYLTYSEVALTVPEQWAKPFQLLYISIFKEAFGWDDEETIHILAEADALAQYVMRTDADSLDDWNHVMFYDFGGHSMVGFDRYRYIRCVSTNGKLLVLPHVQNRETHRCLELHFRGQWRYFFSCASNPVIDTANHLNRNCWRRRDVVTLHQRTDLAQTRRAGH